MNPVYTIEQMTKIFELISNVYEFNQERVQMYIEKRMHSEFSQFIRNAMSNLQNPTRMSVSQQIAAIMKG